LSEESLPQITHERRVQCRPRHAFATYANAEALATFGDQPLLLDWFVGLAEGS
jgi:hypothetical protein